MARSRLKQHLEQQTKRNFFLITLGVGILAVLGIVFGPALLVNFSLLVEQKAENNASASKNDQLIAPPLLDTPPEATNSASIVVSGTALNGQRVHLYRNGRRIKETDIESDRVFRFIQVTLEKGENSFKAKAIDNDGRGSKYSEVVIVIFDIDSPKLTLEKPPDGQSFKKENNPVTVSGKTEPNVRVTVNGFWAIVDDEGNYKYELRLQNGENPITVIAVDEAGNKSEKQIKVTLSE